MPVKIRFKIAKVPNLFLDLLVHLTNPRVDIGVCVNVNPIVHRNLPCCSGVGYNRTWVKVLELNVLAFLCLGLHREAILF